MIDLYETMNMKSPKASRSEVLKLPVITLAREGDLKALEYLKEWTKEGPEEKDTELMTGEDVNAILRQEYRELLLEKRRRELEGRA